MTETQRSWASAQARLAAAVTGAGFPEELTGLLAKELKSPGAMDRMAAWLAQARPRSLETVVDEMLAIRGDLDAWKRKKESEAAQAGVTRWLNSRERWELEDTESLEL